MKKFMNLLKVMLPVVICGVIVATGLAQAAHATEYVQYAPQLEAVRCDGCPEDLFGDNGVFKRITNTILYIVGIVAVIMLVVGGIRYIVSGGDSKKVTDAKNTILYAIIGLIICFLALAIVNFVITSLPS